MDVHIFVSYSSRDRDLRELLIDGLKGHLLHREDFNYKFWTDTAIDLGANWENEIESALQKSKVALLLVSANFAASDYINNKELAVFFKRKKEEGYLILPVLIRQYNFTYFEQLAALNFFKTYYPEYGFNKPIERNKLLPFDKLAENETTTNEQLNTYYTKLADYIHKAVVNFFNKSLLTNSEADLVSFPWHSQQIRFLETFEPNGNPVFKPHQENVWLATLENESYILKNTQDNSAVKYHYIFYENEKIADRPNSIEVKIDGGNGFAGLLSCFNKTAKTYYTFTINRDQEYRLWIRTESGFKKLVSGRSPKIISANFNRLGLIRTANSIYLYINDSFVRRVDNNQLPSGDAGLIAIGKGTFAFDNLTIYEK